MVSFDFAGYLIFAFVTAITPGPNNYLLLSYGKRYGFADSGKFIFGIFLGFSVLLYITGYGIGQIVSQNPTVGLILKIISSIWLFYLAIVMSNLNPKVTEAKVTKYGFYHGFFMQFVNPKGWIIAISGVSAFLPTLGNIHLSVFVFTLSFGLMGVPCMLAWVAFGDAIAKLLTSSKAHTILGVFLFALMMVSIAMIWVQGLLF